MHSWVEQMLILLWSNSCFLWLLLEEKEVISVEVSCLSTAGTIGMVHQGLFQFVPGHQDCLHLILPASCLF